MALVAFDKYQLQMFQSCVFFSDAIEQLFLSRTSLLVRFLWLLLCFGTIVLRVCSEWARLTEVRKDKSV